jgi:NhaA family Na+:H+ antiporter
MKQTIMRWESFGSQIVRPFESFTRLEIAGGILLIGATVAALWLANSSRASLYHETLHFKIGLTFGSHSFVKDLHFLVNEILMTIFFLVIGLEVKRELLVGELASVRKAALPAVAALGGLIVPAGIYYAINAGGPAARGWGIPMATDIAFVLGALAVIGRRAPASLAVFLVSLAIVDDLGAVVVIAVFYTDQIAVNFLTVAGAGLSGLILINILGFRHFIPYAILGIVVWIGVYLAGVHATVAGVLVALTIPCRSKVDKYAFKQHATELVDKFEAKGDRGFIVHLGETNQSVIHALDRLCISIEPPLQRLEHTLHPWSVFLIIPLFALANAGIAVDWSILGETLLGAGALGIILGLCVGKPLGIVVATWLAVKAQVTDLPEGVSFGHVLGGGILCGIGFTMSLFVTDLSFNDKELLDTAKLAVLTASLLSAFIGAAVLFAFGRSGAGIRRGR